MTFFTTFCQVPSCPIACLPCVVIIYVLCCLPTHPLCVCLPCWLSAPPWLFSPVPNHLVYIVCVSLSSRCQFVLVSFMSLASQRFPVLIDLMLPTTTCPTDYAYASPVLDTLPRDRLPARVPTLDRTYYGLCRCLFLLGLVYLCMDFLSLYQIQTVKSVYCSFLVSESCNWIPKLYCTPYTFTLEQSDRLTRHHFNYQS